MRFPVMPVVTMSQCHPPGILHVVLGVAPGFACAPTEFLHIYLRMLRRGDVIVLSVAPTNSVLVANGSMFVSSLLYYLYRHKHSTYLDPIDVFEVEAEKRSMGSAARREDEAHNNIAPPILAGAVA